MSGWNAGPWNSAAWNALVGGSSGPQSPLLALFSSQYRNSPNMLAWAQANLQIYQDILSCLANFGPAFTLTVAGGAQLDILGLIIGQGRIVGFQPSGGVSPILDDTTYRLVLQSRVAQNHWNGQIDTLIAIWQSLFPGGSLIVNDAQKMTVTLSIAGAFTSIIQDLITNGYILPRPQAVLYTYIFATLPMFGFDRDDSFVAGFDTSHWT